jgi:NADH-ubiquinone oxidoreductase chain 6
MITTIVNLLTFGILFSSIISITSNNPVISIIFLITAFVNAAGYLILLGINFIGISYIVIYVGAIAVLFLFIILMINIKLTDILDTGYNFTKNLPIALIIASLLLFMFFSVATHPFITTQGPELDLGSNLFPFSPDSYGGSSTSLLHKVKDGAIAIVDGKEVLLANIAYDPCFEGATRLNPDELFLKDGLILARVAKGEGALSDINLLEFTQIEVLGHLLYTYASIFLILLSLILLLAMLAIIIISKKKITNI